MNVKIDVQIAFDQQGIIKWKLQREELLLGQMTLHRENGDTGSQIEIFAKSILIFSKQPLTEVTTVAN
jgi:hypothetical protein